MRNKVITMAIIVLLVNVTLWNMPANGGTRSAAMAITVTVVRSKAPAKPPAVTQQAVISPEVTFALTQQTNTNVFNNNNSIFATGPINAVQQIFFTQYKNNFSALPSQSVSAASKQVAHEIHSDLEVDRINVDDAVQINMEN